MDAVFIWAVENNFRKIIATVRRENPRAIQFYLNYGFLLQDTDASEVVLAKAIEHSHLD